MVDKGWTEAIEIEVGDKVLLQNGTTAIVEEKIVEQLENPIKVYNFTVDEYHSYFVGQNRIFVHNSCKGGAYKDIKANGGEVHHTPANSVSPYSKGKGPSVWMEKTDHRKTASWGSSKKAKAYRAKQKKLIENGKFMQAVKMDIKDIRSKFRDKYDDGISEMLQYVKNLLKEKK